MLSVPRQPACNGPHEGTSFAGNGDHNLIGMFACGDELAIAFAEADLGLPADGLERWRELFQAQLQVPTDFGRIPVCPRSFD